MDVASFKATTMWIGFNSPARYLVDIPRLGYVLNTLCCSVDLPNPSFNTFNYRQPMPSLRLPFDFIFEPLNLSFYLLDNNEPLQTLQQWQKEMYTDDFRFNDFDSYVEPVVTVTKHAKLGFPNAFYEFYNCYPLYVGPVSLGYENKNTISRVPLSLAYEYSKQL